MANVSVVKLKVRRGTDADRKLIILDQGELGFATDTRKLFVGDGLTAGGISITTSFYTGDLNSPTAFPAAQRNDLIYNTNILTSGLYALTGTDNTVASSYQYIGPSFDNTTIRRNLSGNWSVTLASLSGTLPLSAASTPRGQLCYTTGGQVYIAGL
jgi:hypothetical protein